MSLHLPSRRLVRSATAFGTRQAPPTFLVPCIQTVQRRNWSVLDFFGNSTKAKPKPTPLTEEYLTQKPKARPGALARGSLDDSSIFEDEEVAGVKTKDEIDSRGHKLRPRNPDAMSAALDPQPDVRMRWERKMVIRDIHKRGRLTKRQLLKQQEREVLVKSHDFKTSVKKLMPLAKQITGKTVEEAIVQMRFSKKKVARDVKEHLEHAKNEAIVKRGMGLGLDGKPFTPVKIQTKDGKRVQVKDPTTLYVSQAWCGKGMYGREPDYRARGQIYMMKNPSTSLTLIVKEEATRLRLHEEKETKIKNRKVWVQLPNRPVTSQRQHYSW